MHEVLSGFNLPVGSVALGSVKSNLGHLKGAAGAAGLLKTILALRDKVLPPSANCSRPSHGFDFAHSPLRVNTELRPWTVPADGVRRAGLSAFGFGGTNFHAVLEEYVPHRITGGNGKRSAALSRTVPAMPESGVATAMDHHGAAPVALPVVITGAALGLPGTERIFDDTNVDRILRGDQFIEAIPMRLRRAMVDKNITRVVKSDDGGRFEAINSVADVIKLAARGGALDLAKEFGVSADLLPALDRVTRLVIGAGIDALRDAGLPLVMHYKTTTKGTQLPQRWGLPNALRDDTGVISPPPFPDTTPLPRSYRAITATAPAASSWLPWKGCTLGRQMAILAWDKKSAATSTSCEPPSKKSHTIL